MTEPHASDPDNTLAETFDNPNHNPWHTTESTTRQLDDDERSQRSQQLREEFIRMTTSTITSNNNNLIATPHDYDYRHFNETGYVTIVSTSQRQSLAQAPTTPRRLAALLPIACIATHCLFLYGQIAPMWKLSLSAEDIDLWANSTSTTSAIIFDALHLPNHNYHYQLQQNRTVKQFTYGYAVEELWHAKNLPDAWMAQIAAILLVLFSGIWPHLKLILLQYSWTTPTSNPNRRTQTLGWLALLGKWSLADVLTVCVMVGVLNLEWILEPVQMKEGIAAHLHLLLDLASQVYSASDVCTWALNFDTKDCNHVAVSDMPKCRLCKTFVNNAYTNPAIVESTGKAIVKDIKVSGGGAIRLSVKGMVGIYAFCAAVICSVLLSVVVEWYNHLYLETLRKSQASHSSHHTLSLTVDEDEAEPSTTHDHDAAEPLLLEDAPPRFEPMEIMDDNQSVFTGIVQRTTSNPHYQFFQCHYIMPTITLLFVALAVYLNSMERYVSGAIPELLHDVLGVSLDKTYSLQTLQYTTGAAGGWDWLLMATFALFIVWGPLVRAVLVVFVAMTQPTEDNQRIRSLLVRISNFLAAFCAWEVFLCALIMVELIMPTATDTILNKKACRIVAKNDGGSCLHVEFERVRSTFGCLVLGFILVGGLAIHVSLEAKKAGNLEPSSSSSPEESRGPPNEINTMMTTTTTTTPSYISLPHSSDDGDNDDDHDGNSTTISNMEGNVTTMMQQEMV